MNFLKDILKALLITILIIFIVLTLSWLISPDYTKKSLKDLEQKFTKNFNNSSSSSSESQNSENSSSTSTFSIPNSPVLAQNNFFEGSVDNKYPLLLDLKKDEQNNLSGFVINKVIGLPTRLKGVLNPDNSLNLDEFNQNDEIVGNFGGNLSIISDKLVFNGYWKAKNSDSATLSPTSTSSIDSSFEDSSSSVSQENVGLRFSLRESSDDLTFESDLKKYNQFGIYPQIAGNNSEKHLINVIYPEISGIPNAMVSQKLNQNFRNIFNEEIFKQNALQAAENKQKSCTQKQEIECNLQSILNLRYEIEFNKNNLLSLIFYRETFLVDQESWQQEYFVYNYDLRTGDNVTLASFFGEKSSYKEVLAQKIKEKNPSLNNLEPTLEYFNFNQNGLVFYFGTKKSQRIFIPWESLGEVKNKEGILKDIEL